jgi:DnaJ-class molecular chaperone
MREHSPDPYKVLNLDRAATARDISRAYRSLLRTRHPDVRPAGDAPPDPASRAQELQEIMDAYAVLGDPAKRAAYDRQRPARPQPPETAPPRRDPGPSGPDLIIGPLRWESPTTPGLPAPGRRLLWWIRF